MRILPSFANPRVLSSRPLQRLAIALVASAAVLAACGGSDDDNGASKADMVFRNGAVHTVNTAQPRAEAVAVKDGKIVYVGTSAGLSEWQGESTQVVDLKGGMLLPGFVDTHNHAYLRAENLFWVTVTGTNNMDTYRQLTQQFLSSRPNVNQVRGVGFNLNLVLQTAQSLGKSPRELLDEIVGRDIPAVFITDGHHQIWANTRAIQNAGVTRDTPNPQGAVIDKDPVTGEPTGIFREFGAQNMVISKLPQPDFTLAEYREAIDSFQKLAAERGVTSVLVPIHYPSDPYLDAIQQMDDEGKLTVRYDLLLWADETRGPEQVADFVARRAKYKGKQFKIDSVKIFGTGDSQTVGVWEQDNLNRVMAEADKQGFRIYVHANRATSLYASILDAFEYTILQNGRRDARHAITHVNNNAVPLVDRFKLLEIWADGQSPTPKAFYDAGALVATSSDYPVRDFFPLVRIENGVRQNIPLDAVLRSHTMGSATLMFAEKEAGSIEVGKAADLVVIEKDLATVAADQIDEVKTLMTTFGGKTVYRADTF